jgi:hypothetical protein
MDIAFDSIAFALFLAAHLFAAVALAAQRSGLEHGGPALPRVRLAGEFRCPHPTLQ